MKVLSSSSLQWFLFRPSSIRHYHLSLVGSTTIGRPLGYQLQQSMERSLLPSITTTQVLPFSPFIRYHGSSSSSSSPSHDSTDAHVHADLVSTLEQSGKAGVQITVVGLVANVCLTVAKGAAGWIMNSAALLADAAHSFSDLLCDFVTLYTFKMSRKPPDAIYPYGYGKYETVGSFAVSTLLVTGGVAIGLHSLDLLTAVLDTASSSTTNDTTTTMSLPSSFDVLLDSVSSTVSSLTASSIDATAVAAPSPSSPSNTSSSALSSTMSNLFHMDHHHSNDNGPLDPNAAWFALASVVVKEWLYHATIKIGKREHSDILIANAWHHRSDAYSSMIALVAIGGSYAGVPVLDPLGGLLVSALIVKSGAEIMASSVHELVDKGLTADEIEQIKAVITQVKVQEPHLVDFYSIRGRKLGPFKHLDVILQLDPLLPVHQAHRIEQRVRATVKNNIPMVQEILIHVDAEKQPPHH